MGEKMIRFIWEAAAIGSWCIVRSAIEKQGYSVNLRDCKSNTFLHHAAMVGTAEAIDYFIENGIDINSTNEDGCTPLHMAAQYGCFQAVKHFVEKGADLNALNKNDYNPFHVASQHGNYEIAAYLKWAGTDQDIESYTWRDKFRPRANCKSPVKAQPGNHASS